MSRQDKRKCFTFTWTIENISYYWGKTGESITSPTIVINELQGAKYELSIFPRGISNFNFASGITNDNFIDFGLLRERNSSSIRIDTELAVLSKEGSVLNAMEIKNRDCIVGFHNFKKRNDVFVVNRSVYLPEDMLTVRCRIWKSEGDMTEDVQCFARTRICIERNTFLWNIQNFIFLQSGGKCTYEIKSVLDNELIMTFELFLKNPYTEEDSISVQLVAENGKIKYFIFHITPLNGFSNANSVRKEFLFCENKKPKVLTLPFSKKDLIANKALCLPHDVLSFRCECTFSTGKIAHEIENVFYDCDSYQTSDSADQCLDERNPVSVSKRILNENLKSLFQDNILSDVKLKTSTKTYLAHKNILSARSPVFNRMFENDMKEKFNQCVDIEDLDSDTVYRMLQYVYTAEIQDLQWENAYNLYRAADKYEILALRDECSTYLKSNLCPNTACEVLILADLHQDEELKASVQGFIFNHDVVNSEKWKQLMKTHMELAADTMYLQIHRKTLKFQDKKLSIVMPRFGSNSAKTPSASPGYRSNNEKTMTASSELNGSNRRISSASTGFSSNIEDQPLQLPFHLGIPCATTTAASAGFNSSIPAKPSQPPYSFGIPCATTTAASTGFNSNIPKKPLQPPCSFGISCVTTTAASTGFNSSIPEKPLPSSVSFGNSSEKTFFKPFFGNSSADIPSKPSSSFGISGEKKPVTTSFSFGSSSEKTQTKPSFSFGSNSTNTPVKPSFSFGSSIANTPVKPFFSFGNCSEETPVKPSFSFSDDREKTSSVSPTFNSSSEQTPSTIPGIDNCSAAKPCPSTGSTFAEMHSTFPGLSYPPTFRDHFEKYF